MHVAAESVTEEATEEGEVIYARYELEKLSRADIKEIAVGLGLPPRKSSAAMIEEIMKAQGWQEGDTEQSGETELVTVTEDEDQTEVTEVEVLLNAPLGSGELVQALDQFPDRIHDVLDQFLTDLGKTIEGVIFNGTPEEPEQTQLQPTRRLSRAR